MKNRKRVIIILGLIMISCVGLVAIYFNVFGVTHTVEDKNIKIGVTLYTRNDTFINSISNNLELAAKDMEMKKDERITLNIVSADGSQIKQNDQIDTFIEQNYDVLCVNIVDRTASSIIIDKAKRANIPIVFFNREPVQEDMNRWDKLFYVGSLASVTGNLQGEIIINILHDRFETIDCNGDGKIQYVLLEGEPGHQDASLRTEHCINALMNEGVEMEKLTGEYLYWKRDQAFTKIKQWMQTYGDDIELIIANNDDMALGAIDALKKMNLLDKRPLIVGVDATEAGIQAINDGNLDGTVNINSKQKAQLIFQMAYDLAWNNLIDETVILVDGKYVFSDQSIVTKDSLK
ncbi:MAG TPA: galactose ABC transporter substrate-binding protein [Lachnospiraceae bacterium]|uniref:galactose ABC transporter substrate-binding protein n=1 Tax=Anaerosporobacter sp. TaxID=1872529 RepID=UPI000EF097A2|nr:galactose ABC transporter substrate-binding protein [Anaerosporobacter sp.]HAB61881.1 galactose ABC transporter substrate-binding protein [Lachnospiraceae bacterium]